MFDKKTQFEILKKNLNVGGLIADEIDMVLEPALQKVVENTTTPFDDVAKAALYPVLREELGKLLEKYVNNIFDTDDK